MKADLLPEPERWSERTAGIGGASAEDIVGASFRRIRATTEPSEAAALRWARRAMATPPRPIGGRVWSVAVAAAILAGGGMVAAGVSWRAATTRAPVPAPRNDPSPARPARAHHAAPPLDSEPLPDPEAVLPAPPEPQRLLLRPASKVERAPALEAPAPVSPPPVPAADAPEEARLLARAFRHLRNEGDAAAALAALDERERQFGAGALATEAALARAEALLLLGRTEEALPILVRLRDPREGLTPDVRAGRAELLARAKRCAEATADFDALLAPGGPASTRERALYGRASCRLQEGRAADAAADLESYLRAYPQGRFAPAVRDALEKLHGL